MLRDDSSAKRTMATGSFVTVNTEYTEHYADNLLTAEYLALYLLVYANEYYIMAAIGGHHIRCAQSLCTAAYRGLSRDCHVMSATVIERSATSLQRKLAVAKTANIYFKNCFKLN